MNTKFTPGPWRISPTLMTNEFQIAIDAEVERRDYVCYVSAFDGMPAEANAKLIAAAPELLGEMKRYLPVLQALEENPGAWIAFTKGTGIATLNGYKNAIDKATV